MKDNLFIKIIAGELPCSKVYEDDLVFAFMDIRPINQGHVLVVPKQHAQLIKDIDDETVARMFVVAKKINIALRNSDIRTEGINFLMADGKAAGQEVYHSHLHIIPRYAKDGFRFKFGENYPQMPAREVLDQTAEMIRANI